MPDPKYNSMLVAKFVGCLLKKGKRSVADSIFYDAMRILDQKGDGIASFQRAIDNIKPVIEVKSRRVGGATYQVPVEIRPDRRLALAFRWLISFAKARSEKSMAERLAAEIGAAAKGEGNAVKKRDDTHKMAEANKAFAHYRW
jgi:small subunit ribosomal protein S7